jgi:uncharacterized protein (TIGR00255 family)
MDVLKSMTGYGEAESRDAKAVIRVSARVVNHKGFKAYLKLSEAIAGAESELEKVARARINRGSLDVQVQYEPVGGQPTYKVNTAAVISYHDQLREIQRQLGVSGDVSLPELMALPGSIEKMEDGRGIEPELMQRIVATVSQALDRLVAMRETEGARLVAEIRRSHDQMTGLLGRIEKRAPDMVTEYQQRLFDRVKGLLRGTEVAVSPADLAREVAFFAERCDVTEEITRLRSHLQQMDEALRASEPVGRKLEFLTQEMFREANTMGSKASDTEMVRWILEVKQEIDKVREQVMNIE